MEYITSIQTIKHQYHTGEEPVLVDCSDQRTRVCKYSRSSGSAFKMACELVASMLAEAWGLGNPKVAFVKVLREHIPDNLSPHYFTRPCIGCNFLQGVVDITPTSYHNVPATRDNLLMLMKIALFDFWVANEDRNANNANLMYDIQNDRIVPIDFGCAFNTATFEYPLSQLTTTDTILAADIFSHIVKATNGANIPALQAELKSYYHTSLAKCQTIYDSIIETLPAEWHIPTDIIKAKISELQTEKWVSSVWGDFVECLKENTEKCVI